jgi:hypothetical protein
MGEPTRSASPATALRRLEANGVERREKQDAGAPDLLTGILIDANGEPMTPTHAAPSLRDVV